MAINPQPLAPARQIEARPFAVLIAALGGEGGSVLMSWLVDAARASGLAVQATSVPGVAQRTGSTSYYLEFAPRPPLGTPEPIFSLVPMAGRVDVVIASEAVEAGRMIERGFVAPTRTTLIYSTSRELTIAEKVAMTDGRYDDAQVAKAASALAKRVIAQDFTAMAEAEGTLVSATLFGAVMAADVLPWTRAQASAVIGTGRLATRSLAGFEAAFRAVSQPTRIAPPQIQVASPPAIITIIAQGTERCVDYQDLAYGALYRTRIERLQGTTSATDPETSHALEEAARRLALWMTYEDIPRVAELKTRRERFATIRQDAQMTPGQVLIVQEQMKPGLEEIAAMLPRAIGARLMARHAAGKSLPFLGKPLSIKTTSLPGFFALRAMAQMKRLRLRSWRYHEENTAIERWLTHLALALNATVCDPDARQYAAALAELPRLRKGYSDTYNRGIKNYADIFNAYVADVAGTNYGAYARELRRAIAAALADPDGAALSAILPR